MTDMDSPFLAVPPSDWIAANASAFAIETGFASALDTLVVARRQIATWRVASEPERRHPALVDEVRWRLDEELRPDGYKSASTRHGGRPTVGHLHVHVIPRYVGDMADPRGGVRHVIPAKGNYLSPNAGSYALVDGQDRVLRNDLLGCLRNPRFDRVDLLVMLRVKSG